MHRLCSDCNLEWGVTFQADPGNITLKILFRISCGFLWYFRGFGFPRLTHLEFSWTKVIGRREFSPPHIKWVRQSHHNCSVHPITTISRKQKEKKQTLVNNWPWQSHRVFFAQAPRATPGRFWFRENWNSKFNFFILRQPSNELGRYCVVLWQPRSYRPPPMYDCAMQTCTVLTNWQQWNFTSSNLPRFIFRFIF